MQRLVPLMLVFVLGGVLGFLTSKNLSDDDRISDLADRVAFLTSEKNMDDQRVSELADRVSFLTSEKLSNDERVSKLADQVAALGARALAAGAQRPAPATVGRVQSVSLDGAPIRGRVDAPVTIVEFTDFQCPFCRRVHPTLVRLLEEYPDTVRLAFKHFPLSFHQDAPLAHRASLAADRQGRFWEMHDKIFASSRDLSRSTLIEHAKSLDLDLARFTRDLDSEELFAQLEREVAEGKQLGVTGTPTFFINGRILSGAQPYQNFKALVERAAARARAQTN